MEAQTHLASLQAADQLQQVRQTTGQPINAVDVDSVALTDVLKHFLKLGAVGCCTAGFVFEDTIKGYTVQLTCCVLID
ncbi:hypothetical protein D3C77_670070 [compost metagenome]